MTASTSNAWWPAVTHPWSSWFRPTPNGTSWWISSRTSPCWTIAKAFRELTSHAPDPAAERAEAAETLAASLSALAGIGSGVTGEIVEGGAVEGLVAKVKELGAGQAVVITRPHAIADTFHTDWANKAQDQLGLPVLHLYAGSGFIGDS